MIIVRVSTAYCTSTGQSDQMIHAKDDNRSKAIVRFHYGKNIEKLVREFASAFILCSFILHFFPASGLCNADSCRRPSQSLFRCSPHFVGINQYCIKVWAHRIVFRCWQFMRSFFMILSHIRGYCNIHDGQIDH